ncbi:hypothetical protein OK006_8915 [Actinobacteria bacterium OK006]|nr:hypothetical protein OK006_8915 [Actinobacteria bacterium OK006]
MAIGVWAKNQRAAARKTHESALRRAAGESRLIGWGAVRQPSGGSGRDRPGLVPCLGNRPATRFHLTLAHLRSGGALPVRTGEVIVQGEDLGAWTVTERVGWDKLTPAQQWMLESVLGVDPAVEADLPVRRTQADRWATHLAAAVSSTPAKATCALGGITSRTRPVTAARACLCAWGAGWTTRGVGPTSSPRNAGPNSMLSACAGRAAGPAGGRPGEGGKAIALACHGDHSSRKPSPTSVHGEEGGSPIVHA